jgi:hypothetical protein
MAIDFVSENVRTMMQAAKLAPGREADHLHPATLVRWITHGCRAPGGRRVYLRGARVGAKWVTSVEAVNEFFAALTPQPADDSAMPVRAPGRREKAAQRAGRDLESAGV